MAFTGRATSGHTLPDGVEDMSDLVAIASPYETPLLDALGDPAAPAKEFLHTWIENEIMVKSNHMQVFTAAVEVDVKRAERSGVGVADELDYQKQEGVRNVLRHLECCVINGAVGVYNTTPTNDKMRGILGFLTTHVFRPGDGFPADKAPTEEQLRAGLDGLPPGIDGRVDLIVVGGQEARAIKSWIRCDKCGGPANDDSPFPVSAYEGINGVCRVILSRWVPPGTVLLLDSSRIKVLPLAGRSFHYNEIVQAAMGAEERIKGEIVGEYTLELQEQDKHGVIRLEV